jgi:dTDP-4-dehydrorhamnose reductase
MPKLLITGAGGQLGQELSALAENYPAWDFLLPLRHQLDINNSDQVQAYFTTHHPDYCLNTAAYTAVDRAEEEREAAFATNATAVQHLAEVCKKHHTHLLHYSTDYVYQSGINRPLKEDDPTQTQGVYAASKLTGDQLALMTMPSATVIRTSWVYSSYGNNFVKTMLRLGKERDELKVVFDQVGTPTYARDLALLSLQLIDKLEDGSLLLEDIAGVFHYSNEGVCSWYDFALSIFELTGIDCAVFPIESWEYPTPAKRPHYSVLNKAKIKRCAGIVIKHWRVALQDCLRQSGEIE